VWAWPISDIGPTRHHPALWQNLASCLTSCPINRHLSGSLERQANGRNNGATFKLRAGDLCTLSLSDIDTERHSCAHLDSGPDTHHLGQMQIAYE
jgi:hypothetical protein